MTNPGFFFALVPMMRRDIKRLLRGTRAGGEAELDELARRVVDVARRRLA